MKEFRIKHHLVLKSCAMMLNDYVYESISNIASLKIIDSS
jgi:hypothetical protein